MKFVRRALLAFCTSAVALCALTSSAQSNDARTIGILFDSLVSPFWLESLARMRSEAEARGWTVLEGVSNMDDNRQFQQVQSMIQRGVDGIILVHTDARAVIPAIRVANGAGVPLVHFNRQPARSDAYSVAIVADNRRLMRDTVKALIEIARQKGGRYKAAVLLGDLSDANGANRRDGIEDAITQNADVVEVAARIATEWNADKAFSGLINALRAHPDINMLITSSDFLAPQIEQALRSSGKWHRAGEVGHVLIAGFDGDAAGYAHLADGYFDVDGVQDLEHEVDLTFDALQRMWAGERPPEVLVDPGFVITRDTLEEKRHRMWGYAAWSAALDRQTVGRTSMLQNGVADPSGAGLQPAGAGDGKEGTDRSMLRAFGRALFSVGVVWDIVLAMLPLAILVAGQMLVLLVRQIDLSMIAVVSLSSILSAAVMTRFDGGGAAMTVLGIATCLLIGLSIGLFNGICTAVLRMPSFIVTLAVMMAGSGAAIWYASVASDTISIGGLPEAFVGIGYGTIAGIPIALILSAAVLLAIAYLLGRTVWGRWFYAVGHNPEAARICGVPVQDVTVAAFALSGLCAGVASMVYTSRVETGLPTLGQTMLLDIVGAAVIGGVSLFGGRGTVMMVLVGVLFFCVLDKSLQLLGFSLFLVLAIKGAAILAAATIDVTRQRKKARA